MRLTIKELKQIINKLDNNTTVDMKIIQSKDGTVYNNQDEESFHVGTRIVGQSNNDESNNDDRIDWGQYLDEIIDDE